MVRLTIKNMVCRHCVSCVRSVLSDELHLAVESVSLGCAEIDDVATPPDYAAIEAALEREGFELIHSRDAEIIDSVKRTLISLTRRDGDCQRESLSALLDGKYGISYASLSRLFSEIEGRSLENYFISLRIERVKELIKYHKLSLSEIAYMMGYSSVAHLSRQFKQTTGLTPTQFREIGGDRIPLPEL
ncbi:MAG: helix-turn-helix domain-containing protein [Muribaculaceae bacterium]